MIIFSIDDEEAILRSGRRILEKVAPDATIYSFTNGKDVLNAIKKDGIIPDIAFTDIEMPGMTGLQLATKMKALVPDVRIVFVTAFSDYAVNAFKVRAQGYVVKPASVKDIREEIERVPNVYKPDPNKIQAQCFGHFEVFYKGEPLVFQRRQTKELLAFLIDREGVLCTSDEIGFALWEEDTDMAAVGQRVRNLISDLRSTLSEIGMEDALIRDHRQVAIKKDMFDCDYYRLLEGDADAVNSFKGEYMVDYSWAEYTTGKLTFDENYE